MNRTAVASRVLPFSDDKLLELLEDGKDIESIADAWDYAALKRKHAYQDAVEFADTHPLEPLTDKELALLAYEKARSRVGNCPGGAIFGWDTAGHNYAKEIYCGREWCPICGQKDSKIHLRRFASWLPKVQTVKSLGYFVIEFPLVSRERFHSKAALERAGKLVTSVLKGDYEIQQRRKGGEVLRKGEVKRVRSRWFSKGLRRWHFFGDAPSTIRSVVERQQGVSQLPLGDEFAAVRYNPHLNVLVGASFIPDNKLDYIKAMLRAAFNCSDLIVNYSFTDLPGKMVHLVKYVTRATFLDISWDKYLAGSLYGFRNMRSWGKWVGESVWSLSDLDSKAKEETAGVDIEAIHSLGESRCPLDGLPIHWSKPMPMGLLHYLIKTQGDAVKVLGAGYYRLKDGHFGGELVGESDTMHWQRLLNIALARVRADERCGILARHELRLDKVLPTQSDGVLADSSALVSQKAVKTDKNSAGIRQTNLFDSAGQATSVAINKEGGVLPVAFHFTLAAVPTPNWVGGGRALPTQLQAERGRGGVDDSNDN